MQRPSQREQLPFPSDGREPILMPLYPRNYSRIWEGTKCYEFRKRFVASATHWYVYLGSPVLQVVARIELGIPHHCRVEELEALLDASAVAERKRLSAYFSGHSHGYAIPIQSVAEYEPIPRCRLPGISRVPNDFLRLRWNQTLLEALEASFDSTPVRTRQVPRG